MEFGLVELNEVGYGWGRWPTATSPRKRRASQTECLYSFDLLNWWMNLWMNQLKQINKEMRLKSSLWMNEWNGTKAISICEVDGMKWNQWSKWEQRSVMEWMNGWAPRPRGRSKQIKIKLNFILICGGAVPFHLFFNCFPFPFQTNKKEIPFQY